MFYGRDIYSFSCKLFHKFDVIMEKNPKPIQTFMEKLFNQPFPEDLTTEEALWFLGDIGITSPLENLPVDLPDFEIS